MNTSCYWAPTMPPKCQTKKTPSTMKKCKYIQPPKPQSCRPHVEYVPPEAKMEDGTVYSLSYTGKRNTDGPTCGLVFGPNSETPCLPCNIPCFPCEMPYQPCDAPCLSFYQPCEVPCPPCQPCAPCQPCNAPQMCTCFNGQMVDCYPPNCVASPCGECFRMTVPSQCFQPRKKEKEDQPWRRQPKYKPPTVKMEDTTVQKLSYAPPGEYVDCTDDDADFADCYTPFMRIPPCEGPSMCCNMCRYQEQPSGRDSKSCSV